MSTATVNHPEICDETLVETIVHGPYSTHGAAIGGANLPTLQRAAQRCQEAKQAAIAAGQPHGQWHTRAILCRGRIGRLVAARKASF